MLAASPASITPPAPAQASSADAPTLLPGDSLEAALALGERLAATLEAEFEALKARDIEAMEQLQPGKTAQLQALSDWAAQAAPREDQAAPPGWPEFVERMDQCRQTHWRNETLLMRQLDAIRGTLRALHAGEDAASVELYDRMGKVARRLGARGYSDA